jgi:hypothetical protein
MIPEWFINMFGVDTIRDPDAGPLLVSSVAAGAEFIYRKDGFDITAAVWYADFGWDEKISFKGKSEDSNSWEVVENNTKAILLTADFIWSTSFTDWVAITYGAGLGLGIKLGDIVRTEARDGQDRVPPDDPPRSEKCEPQDIGNDPLCNEGEHYGAVYDKLPIIPWINFLLGFRFKPHRHVAIHVDGGFGLGFQMGTRVGYIF